MLSNNTIQQPVDLGQLEQLYVTSATGFINSSAAAGKPFYLYYPFNHIHSPESSGPAFCGKSAHTVGDATEEVDWAVGRVMDTVKATSNIRENTLVILTSDK